MHLLIQCSRYQFVVLDTDSLPKTLFQSQWTGFVFVSELKDKVAINTLACIQVFFCGLIILWLYKAFTTLYSFSFLL